MQLAKLPVHNYMHENAKVLPYIHDIVREHHNIILLSL